MRFPKLPRFFHKRSQSDSSLYQRTQPAVALPPRPVSVSFSNGAVLPFDAHSGALSDFLSAVSATPLAVPAPQAIAVSQAIAVPHAISTPHTIAVPPPASSSTVSSGAATHCSSASRVSAAAQPVVIDVLTRRIQELEDTLRAQEDAQARVSDLEHSLESARHNARAAAEESKRLLDEIENLKTDLARHHTESAGLRTENARLTALLALPLLQDVLAHISGGASAEDALVGALQAAVAAPESAWRALLEPVTGPRAPEHYIAQVHCTLRARREGRDWSRRAAFWKGAAREDGRHQDTVTPSASQLSDVLEAAAARASAPVAGVEMQHRGAVQVHVEVVQETMRDDDAPFEPLQDLTTTLSPTKDAAGSSGVLATLASEDPVSGVVPETTQDENMPSEPLPCSPPPLSPIEEDDRSSGELAKLATLAAEDPMSDVVDEALVEASRSAQSVKEDPPPVPYANLAPLASVIFRESHSIRSMSSKKESVVVPSASVASQASRLSSKRSLSAKEQATAVGVAKDAGNAALAGANSCSSMSISNSNVHWNPGSQTSPAPTPAPVSTFAAVSTPAASPERPTSTDFSSTSWDLISNIIDRSFSFNSMTAPSADTKAKDTHMPVARPQAATLPPPPPRPRPSHATSPLASPTSSPTSKKSRLPLPTALRSFKPTMKAVRRLSKQISKPVLVDSTNAAAVGDAAPARAVAAKGPRKASDAARTPAPGPGAVRRHEKDVRGAEATQKEGKENLVRPRRPTVVGKGESPARKRPRLYTRE